MIDVFIELKTLREQFAADRAIVEQIKRAKLLRPEA